MSDPVFAISTGAIIAIAVVAALILIALLVLLPRMRKQAAERKAEQQRRERERKLERERQEKADEHRSEAEQKRHRAELAEAEAKRSRAEADIDSKRAELHEGGLADHELPSGDAAVANNGRVDESDMRRGNDRDVRSGDRDSDRGVRDLGGGGRAHEPVGDDSASVDRDRGRGGEDKSAYEQGLEDGRERTGDAGDSGGSRRLRPEDHNEVDEGRPGPLR